MSFVKESGVYVAELNFAPFNVLKSTEDVSELAASLRELADRIDELVDAGCNYCLIRGIKVPAGITFKLERPGVIDELPEKRDAEEEEEDDSE